MQDLPMRHRILARSLHGRTAVHKIQHHGEWQLLAVEVGDVGHAEVGQGEAFGGAALVLHRLRDGEGEVSTVVNGDDAAFPELRIIKLAW